MFIVLQKCFTGWGETAEAAKKDMLKQMEFYEKTAIEEGFSYPDFLGKEFEIVYNSNTEN